MADPHPRYGFERFDCAPALRLDAHEKLAQIQHDSQQRRMEQLADQIERLERRIWLTLYGVVGVILTQAIQKIISLSALG